MAVGMCRAWPALHFHEEVMSIPHSGAEQSFGKAAAKGIPGPLKFGKSGSRIGTTSA